jgi:single-stranded-DNA-specific exonuclease
MDELDASDQPLAPWVYLSQAPKGMLGLLAGKLAERHLAPVVVLGEPSDPDEPVSGSGRAPAWFDIIETLDPHPGLTAIGHAQACGVHTDTATDIKRLADVLATQTQALIRTGQIEPAGTSTDLLLGPGADCDAPTSNLGPLTELVRRISGLRPFGQGFTQPRFGIVIEPQRCRLSRIGSEREHLRLVTGDGLACLWWNAADDFYEPLRALIATQTAAQADALATGLPAPVLETIRLEAHLQLNHWNGTTRLQAVVTQMPESEALLGRA